MKLFKMFAAVLSVAVLCLLAVPSASADDWNRKTVITFSGPVEVPGVGAQTLPAGTYVFKIFDSQSDRHIVQIFNQDETHVFTTILAIPNYRLKTTDKTVISFRERPVGQPEALKAWFYPGRQWGEEFVYAKSRAVELAKETNEPVLATPIELAAAPIEALKTAPIEAVDPKGEPIELAQVVEAPPAAAEPETVAENSLPKTASSLPLVGLMGLVALVAGLGLMLISRRVLLN
jgi:LPXTG-motif cell wall-anchored protein